MTKKPPTIPDISVIIVTYNSASFVTQTLDSLLTQIKVSYEIIIVDNASTDATLSIIKNAYPQVKIVRRPTSVGFAAANNLGLKKATAKTILFLNPDVTFLTNLDLFRCYEHLQSLSNVAALSPRVNLTSTGEIDATCHRGFPTPWASFSHFTGLSRVFPKLAFFNQYTKNYLGYTQEHNIDAVGGMFILIKRDIGALIEWWDESFPFYGEDLDLCFRIWEKGYQIRYYPAVVILHHKGISTGMSKSSLHLTRADASTTRQVKKWSIQAMKIFYNKHYQTKYPRFVSQLVYLGLRILSYQRLGRVEI